MNITPHSNPQTPTKNGRFETFVSVAKIVRNRAKFKYSIEPNQSSLLVKEKHFYTAFAEDINQAQQTVEIMCPFVSFNRIEVLEWLSKLSISGGGVIIYTRPPASTVERDFHSRAQQLGFVIELREYMHEKLAIIDGTIVWEGSLNILKHYKSSESMRRLVGANYASQHRELHNLKSVESVFNASRQLQNGSS